MYTHDSLLLFPRKPRLYKANTHVHSSVSDGSMTPGELKALYQSKGYQILAFTDHELCVPHAELADEDFLPLTAYEIALDVEIPNPRHCKSYHFCLLSKEPGMAAHLLFDPDYIQRYCRRYPGDCSELDIRSRETRRYSLETAQRLIREANEAGYLVTYNHPCWSLQDRDDYMELEGLWAVEIYNHVSFMEGHDDNDHRPWEALLRSGRLCYPIAADDTHFEDINCGSWLTVAANALDYADVIDSLEKGDFFASTGPAFHRISLSGGILRVECSPCRAVSVATEQRCAWRENAGEEALTCVEIDLHRWFDLNCEIGYFRITLEDAQGYQAFSRAFTRKEVEAYF